MCESLSNCSQLMQSAVFQAECGVQKLYQVKQKLPTCLKEDRMMYNKQPLGEGDLAFLKQSKARQSMHMIDNLMSVMESHVSQLETTKDQLKQNKLRVTKIESAHALQVELEQKQTELHNAHASIEPLLRALNIHVDNWNDLETLSSRVNVTMSQVRASTAHPDLSMQRLAQLEQQADIYKQRAALLKQAESNTTSESVDVAKVAENEAQHSLEQIIESKDELEAELVREVEHTKELQVKLEKILQRVAPDQQQLDHAVNLFCKLVQQNTDTYHLDDPLVKGNEQAIEQLEAIGLIRREANCVCLY